jgi:hypothetical protein
MNYGYFDSCIDPVDNSVPFYYFWKSASSTGDSTTIFCDLFINSSAPISFGKKNFPAPSSGQTPSTNAYWNSRGYLLDLPGEPIIDNNHPFILKGHSLSTSYLLKRVMTTSDMKTDIGGLGSSWMPVYLSSTEYMIYLDKINGAKILVCQLYSTNSSYFSFCGYFKNNIFNKFSRYIYADIPAWNMSSTLSTWSAVSIETTGLWTQESSEDVAKWLFSSTFKYVDSNFMIWNDQKTKYYFFKGGNKVLDIQTRLYNYSTFFNTTSFRSTSISRGVYRFERNYFIQAMTS